MFTPEQNRIYDGLKEIGESIANYYLDTARLASPDCTLLSKANLIAHLAREIDSGLKDVFAPDNIREAKQKELGLEDRGHFAAILTAIGKSDPKNKIALEWHSIATKFHKIAHRHQVYKPSKDSSEAIALWNRYEKILGIFIGSYYSILERLDSFLSMPEPPASALPALWNLLSNPSNNFYFFSRLSQPNWLNVLYEAGFFELKAAPVKKEGTYPLQWMPIVFLANISGNKSADKFILEIIDKIMTGYLNDELELHPYTVTDITRVILKAESQTFSPLYRQFYEKYTSIDHDFLGFTYISLLTKEFAQKLVSISDSEGLKELMQFAFGYRIYTQPGLEIDDIALDPFVQRKPFLEEHFLREFITTNGKQILDLLGVDAIETVINKLADLSDIDGYSQLSGFSIPSIEESEQISMMDTWLYHFVTFIRDYTEILPIEDKSSVIKKMLQSNAEILKRLAIHLLRQNFAQLHEIWWAYVQDSVSPIYIHEPFLLIEETSPNYSDEQTASVIKWIEVINNFGEAELSRSDAYSIRRWLKALHPLSSESQQLLYSKIGYYESINDTAIEHPSFDSFGELKFGNDYPIELETFSAYSVEQQAEFISTFKQEHEYETHERGLSELFRHCVKSNPEKYIYKLDLFLQTHSFYLHSIISGFTEAMRENRLSEFLLVIDFVDKILQSENYKNEEPKKYHSKGWFIASITELISFVSKRQEDFKLLKEDWERLIDLLLYLLQDPQYRVVPASEKNDLHNYILNSTQGKLHRTLFHLILLGNKLYIGKDETVRWTKKVREYFESRLERNNDTDNEFSFILGERLPMLLYLDKAWVYQHLKRILPLTNDSHYDITLHGAVNGYYRPSKDLYALLKSNGLFHEAIARITVRSNFLDRIIGYGFLEIESWGIDYDDNSIFKELIERANITQLQALTEYIIRQKYLSFDRIKFIWIKLNQTLQNTETKEAFGMTFWFYEFAPALNEEIFKLIDNALDNISNGSNATYFLLRNILEKADSSLELSAKLVSKLLSKKHLFAHYDQRIVPFVTKLYNNAMSKIADEICLNAAASGDLTLKEVYESNKGKFLE